jgi:hypothetical protein
VCSPPAVCALSLVPPAGQEIRSQRHPPVVSCPPGVPETAGLDPQEALVGPGQGGRPRLRRGAAFPEEPQPPGVPGAQALAPGRLRDVGKADQPRPRPQAAGREGPEDIREQTASQGVRGREAADTLERFGLPSPLGQGGGQAWHHCGGPGLADQGERLWRHNTVRIMVEEQQRVLLERVVMASPLYATGSPCWAGVLPLRCLSTRLWAVLPSPWPPGRFRAPTLALGQATPGGVPGRGPLAAGGHLWLAQRGALCPMAPGWSSLQRAAAERRGDRSWGRGDGPDASSRSEAARGPTDGRAARAWHAGAASGPGRPRGAYRRGGPAAPT